MYIYLFVCLSNHPLNIHTPTHHKQDNTCTDIIHYEGQKLVAYHGNLSAFVAKRPDAKHYYELSTETLR